MIFKSLIKCYFAPFFLKDISCIIFLISEIKQYIHLVLGPCAICSKCKKQVAEQQENKLFQLLTFYRDFAELR